MLRFLILAIAIVSVNSYKPALKWPKKYAGHITKVYVKSGIVEEIDLWKTLRKSRIDYNDGAVKSFYFIDTQYEIYPQTSTDAEIVIGCDKKHEFLFTGPKTLFPSLEGFDIIGTDEMMRDKKCTKLAKVQTIPKPGYEHIIINHTLWIYFEHKVHAYLPVRYEIKSFNTWLGQNKNHAILDFYDFDNSFKDAQVFNPKKYCSDSEATIHKKNDESITKHLMFVDPDNTEHVDHVYKKFNKKFNLKYVDHKEHALRKTIFQENMRLIRSTNLKNLGYKLGVNQFTHLLPEEVKKYTGRVPRPEGERGTHPFPYDEEAIQENYSTLPKTFDLRDQGFVSKVENQGSCGSCWTFGTTAAVEGALARSNGGKMMKLAKQALVDCAWEFGPPNQGGCNGGTDSQAYKMVMKYGLPTEADYGTYAGQDGYCKIKNMTKTFKIRGFVDVTPESPAALKVALVEHGPLSVSVQVTDPFAAYSGGIFYDLNCQKGPMDLNHEVTLVGYGEKYGEPYWLLKNSWGQDWGEAGFMQISAKDNNCGVMTEPTYVLF